MPFGDIVSQTLTYSPRSPGIYSLSTLSFGDPRNEFSILGARAGKDGKLRSSVARLLEKDITTNGVVSRQLMSVVLSIVSPASGFTSSEMDSAALDISNFLTSSIVTRLMQGEQ